MKSEPSQGGYQSKLVYKANLSTLLGADPAVVNLKAKTHEKVDSLLENRVIGSHTGLFL